LLFIPSLFVGQLGGFVSAFVHGGRNGDQRMVGFGQNGAAFFHLVSVQADNQLFSCCIAKNLQCLHNTAGDLVAGGNATENVYEYGINLFVTQDHIQSIGHDLCVSTATDVEEVGWFDVAVVFSSVGNDVQCRHDQAGTVTNNANRAVKFHIVQAFSFSLGFQWVLSAFVDQFSVCWLTEIGVVIHGNFTVESNEVAFTSQNERVYLNECGIFLFEDVTELDQHVGKVALHVFSKFCFFCDLFS